MARVFWQIKQVQSIVSTWSFQRLEKVLSMVTPDLWRLGVEVGMVSQFIYTFFMRQRLRLFFVLTRKKPASETFLQKPRWNWLCLGESVFGRRLRPSYWIIGLGKVESIHTKANVRCHCIALQYNGGQNLNSTLQTISFCSIPLHVTFIHYMVCELNTSHYIRGFKSASSFIAF